MPRAGSEFPSPARPVWVGPLFSIFVFEHNTKTADLRHTPALFLLAFFFLTFFFSIEKSSSKVQNCPVLYVADLKILLLLLLLFWHKRKKKSKLGLICILKIIYLFLFCGNQGAARVAYPPN